MTQRSSGLSEERRRERERVAMIRQEMARDFVEGEEWDVQQVERKKKENDRRVVGKEARILQCTGLAFLPSPFSTTTFLLFLLRVFLSTFFLCFPSLSPSNSTPRPSSALCSLLARHLSNTRGIEEGWTESERERELFLHLFCVLRAHWRPTSAPA